jgi:hypothetical protein
VGGRGVHGAGGDGELTFELSRPRGQPHR